MKKQDLLRLPELSVTERMKELVNEDIPTKKTIQRYYGGYVYKNGI